MYMKAIIIRLTYIYSNECDCKQLCEGGVDLHCIYLDVHIHVSTFHEQNEKFYTLTSLAIINLYVIEEALQSFTVEVPW